MKTMSLLSTGSCSRLLAVLAIIIGGLTSSYSQNSPVFIPWDENGLSTRLEVSGNYAFSRIQVINGASVAFLTQNSDEIFVYRLNQPNRPAERIPVPVQTEDFYIENDGDVYVVSPNTVAQIDRKDGRPIREWHLQRPAGEIWSLHRVYVENDRIYLLTADEKTWELTTDGLRLVDGELWRIGSNTWVRT